MRAEERVEAVVKFGFTKRQARFLVTVMLHSGVCLLRHYTAFAGIVHGQKTRKFFAKLVRHGYATAYSCRHNRGHVYHVQHKPLYRAIGETDSRLRRPRSAARVMERLPLLDALLACPDVVWLATSEEKQVHLSTLGGNRTDEAARLALSERVSRVRRSSSFNAAMSSPVISSIIKSTPASNTSRIQLESAFAFAVEALRTSSDTRASSLARCQHSRAAARASSHTSSVSAVAWGDAKAREGNWPSAVGA